MVEKKNRSIVENNKLIAEFMAYKTSNNQIKDENGFWEDMLFHESWDWLMPVVDKIENLNNGFGFSQYKNSCSITEDNTEDFWVLNTQGRNKFEATYKAVVKFIKWYKQQSN